jgi:hypothetical protein
MFEPTHYLSVGKINASGQVQGIVITTSFQKVVTNETVGRSRGSNRATVIGIENINVKERSSGTLAHLVGKHSLELCSSSSQVGKADKIRKVQGLGA